MIQFACDYCQVVKRPEENWILGLAAEAVGVTAARREVNILSAWDSANSVHPLAVHFCSEACKEGYIQELFGDDQQATTTVKSGSKVKTRNTASKRRRAA